MADRATAVAPRETPERSKPSPPLRAVGPTRAPAGIPPAVGRLSLARRPGEPLPDSVAGPIGTSLGVDVSPVRVHADAAAAEASTNLGARAFALGSGIFLGRGERPTDLPLMAHEVAHVVQQQGAPRAQPWSGRGGDRHEQEAQRAATAVVSGDSFTVSERTSPRVQRFGLKDALDYFADKAYLIPGYRMFTIVLGINPINMSSVDRSPANILRALVEFIPGGGLIVQALDNHGVFEKAGAWVDQQLRTLGVTGAAIKAAISTFLDSLGWRDIFDLGGVWERAKAIFTTPIRQIIDFAAGLVSGIVKLIKDAILLPLAKLAEGTKGWDLLIAVLGKNPITGDPVPRTAQTLIGGFMKLIGQEEVWERMQKTNATGRAWAWFQGALAGLMSFVAQIPTLAINAFKSLELMDIVLLPKAFAKVAAVFGNFIGSFIDWAGKTVWKLLEIIFEVVSPAAWGYIKRTGAALKSILKNPLPFVGNLVKAAKTGFLNFASNFLEHLKAGLIDWLTGSLPGVYIPKAFTLGELVKFVFSVLGISWENVRQKLVKVVGEGPVKAMEAGFDIVRTLVMEGPAAAWEKIKESLGNLKDMVIGGITDFVVDTVVKKAIPKLVAMFIPGAGFISAIISIYDTVMVFVQKISKIIQVVTSFIDSIVAIAQGAIGAAATKVESILAGLLSLAISFLAGFVGLGKVADKVMGVINKVRTSVDKAIDALIAWIVKMAKALFAKVFGKDKEKKPGDLTPEGKLEAAVEAGSKLLADPNATLEDVKAKLPGIQVTYGLKVLTVVVDTESEEEYEAHIYGEINPPKKSGKRKVPKSAKTTKIGPIEIPREKMKWLKAAKVAIARKFVGAASVVQRTTGRLLTKRKYGRRHIVSFADIADHYKKAFHDQLTVEKACELLAKFGIEAKFTKKSVHSKVRSLARRAFNEPENVRIGLQAENSSLGREVDPTDEMLDAHGKRVQARLDAHVQAFLIKWGVPGVPFGVSEEQEVVEWEIIEA